MSLTIDDGSMIYYFKSNSQIKRVSIEGSENQISFHAADKLSCSELTRSSTSTSTVFSKPGIGNQLPDVQPITYTIEDIQSSPHSNNSPQNSSKACDSTTKTVPSLRKASYDLLRVIGVKLTRAGKYSGQKVNKAYHKIKTHKLQ